MSEPTPLPSFVPLADLRQRLAELGDLRFTSEVLRDRPVLLFGTPEGLEADETVATSELFQTDADVADPSSWYRDTAAMLFTRRSEDPREVLVGRTAECDLILALPGVSRRHALLREDESGWTLSDLDSSAGTFLNGERLPSGTHPVRDGDVLRFGTMLPLGFCSPQSLIRLVDPSA